MTFHTWIQPTSCPFWWTSWNFMGPHFRKNWTVISGRDESRMWQLVVTKDNYHLDLCLTTQWTTSFFSTHITKTNMGAPLAQKRYMEKMTMSVSAVRKLILWDQLTIFKLWVLVLLEMWSRQKWNETKFSQSFISLVLWQTATFLT